MNNGKPSFKEIATTEDGRDITRGFISYPILQPQDKILERSGTDYTKYEDLFTDYQIFTCWQQRNLAIVSKEYKVFAGGTRREDKKAAGFIEEVLKQVKFDNLTRKMHYGIFYGFAAAEAIWAIDNNQVYPEQIKVRKQRRFRFNPDYELLLLTTKSPLGEKLPERKFWHFSAGADNDDEPYGFALAHVLYWLNFFKKNDIKFWLQFLEKFGDPTAWGQYDIAASEEDRKKLLEALQRIKRDSAITTPKGLDIGLIEASRSGTADYSIFLDKMDKAISKVILSQTMTTDDGSSYSQSKVHEGVAKQVIKADADLICESFNKSIVKWLIEWNYPNAALPEVWREFETPEDLTQKANREDIIHGWGFRPNLDYLKETYELEDWEDTQVKPQLGAREEEVAQEEAQEEEDFDFDFAAPEEQQDFLEDLQFELAQKLNPIIKTWLAAIETQLSQADDLTQFQELLEGLELNTEQFQNQMAQGLILARLAGEDDARNRL